MNYALPPAAFTRCEKLYSLASHQALHFANPELKNQDYIASLHQAIMENGVTEPLTDTHVAGRDLSVDAGYREGASFRGINSRARAVLLAVQWAMADIGVHEAKIYAAEAVTAFALRLRGIYPKFIGSEFCDSEEQKKTLFPIPHEDLTNLSFADDLFDIVITNEVLEHVSSIDDALREMYRVLKPGGSHIGTVPCLFEQQDSVVRARLVNGDLVHLLEPEYHGDPVRAEGVLVFEVPGWDILDRARAVGFSDAHMKFILSTEHGCLDDCISGILVLCLQK